MAIAKTAAVKLTTKDGVLAGFGVVVKGLPTEEHGPRDFAVLRQPEGPMTDSEVLESVKASGIPPLFLLPLLGGAVDDIRDEFTITELGELEDVEYSVGDDEE